MSPLPQENHMKSFLYALLVGVLLIVSGRADASGHTGISQGPVSDARAAVVAEAQRLGISNSDLIVTGLASLDFIRSKYSYDLGQVYECQTPAPDALQLMTDRVLAFDALNVMAEELRANGSNLQPFAPVNGTSHVETIAAMESTWPLLKALSPDLVAAAGVASQMVSLQALEDQHGTLNFEWGTANHWAISHPAAQSIIAVDKAVKAYQLQQRQLQQQNLLYAVLVLMLVLLLMAGAVFFLARPKPVKGLQLKPLTRVPTQVSA